MGMVFVKIGAGLLSAFAWNYWVLTVARFTLGIAAIATFYVGFVVGRWDLIQCFTVNNEHTTN